MKKWNLRCCLLYLNNLVCKFLDALPVAVYEIVTDPTSISVQIIPENETVDEYRIYFSNNTEPVVSRMIWKQK